MIGMHVMNGHSYMAYYQHIYIAIPGVIGEHLVEIVGLIWYFEN